MGLLRRLLLIAWASPNSLLGLTAGLIALGTGGGVQLRRGVIEFWGGGVAWFLRRIPTLDAGASAMTLGHTVLGRTPADLDHCRTHELVHVRQYERWGPFFIPAYVLCSVALHLAGKDHYHDNPFEREAFNWCDGADEDDANDR